MDKNTTSSTKQTVEQNLESQAIQTDAYNSNLSVSNHKTAMKVSVATQHFSRTLCTLAWSHHLTSPAIYQPSTLSSSSNHTIEL